MNPENSSSHEPATRCGKVARLPHSIREELNRRLQNGEEGKKLVEWLNAMPETQAILAADFDGQPINEPNLSRWKAGGYREWEAKQEALEIARHFCANGPELAKAGVASLTENLAFRTAVQLAVIVRQIATPDDERDRHLESLSKLCGQIAQLRRGDHRLQWLQIQREKLAFHLQKYRDQAARKDKALPENVDPVTMDDFRKFEIRENLL